MALVLGVAVVAGQVLPRFTGGGPSPAAEVTSPEQAAAVALAQDPRFAGLRRRDPDLIGQGSWWEAAEADGAYQVTVRIGWDDCEAGCISQHTWTYEVRADGSAALLSEEGDPLPTR